MNADDAVNYGGIGAVIGHEISHGFDDSGRQFDGDGNLRDWWTAEDGAKFKQRADALVDAIRRLLGARQPPHQRQADARREHRRPVGHGGGAQGATGCRWPAGRRRSSTALPANSASSSAGRRSGAASTAMRSCSSACVTDPHSPSEFRTNGPTSNIDAFYDAFGVKPGDRMYRPPNERVKIW